MRYGACTAEDIIFLKSRIAGRAHGRPKLNNAKFRNISVITAWNSHKDRINDLGCKRFADDTKQNLTTFYSVHSVSANISEGRKLGLNLLLLSFNLHFGICHLHLQTM